MKRTILFLALLLSSLGTFAYDFGAVAPTGQWLYYNIVNGNAVVTSQNQDNPYYSTYPTRVLEIPSTVTYNSTTYSVTSIGDNAFYDCGNLTRVSIPNSVTSIGSAAFGRCSGLTSVTIPNSVTNIGNSAFNGCSRLTSVTIPNSVTSIGEYAFINCSRLTSVTIPNSVTAIGEGAFYFCSGLTSVTIPNSVTSIGDFSFSDCTGLTSVTIPNSVTSIGSYSFRNCTDLTNVTIPNSVTSIGGSAFSGCSGLTSVTIGNSVPFIAMEVFSGCSSLTSVTIPNSVTFIGTNAFEGCSNLQNVIIGNSVFSINGSAFDHCPSLKTAYNLSATEFTLPQAKRIVPCTSTGSGLNTLYQISNTNNEFIVVNQSETACSQYQIPKEDLPDNFIYSNDNGSTWQAKNIVLTDSRTENNPFTCDVDFTAASVTYNREFDDDRSSTMCLPFAITPEMRDVTDHKFKLYDFYSYNAQTGMATFNVLTDEVSSVANHPYLIQYENNAKGVFQMPAFSNVQFSATTSMNNPTPSNGFHFEGTYTQQTMANTANKEYYGIYYGYFVKSNGEAKVNPFRGYFYTLDAPQGAPAPAGIDYQENEGNVGIELVDPEDNIRYSNDVYDLMGRCVRKNADSLRGLPQGIYIWKGKKMLNY